MVLLILIFVVSLATLLFASDKFVESAESIGLSLGIPPFIIGVTIVAFGTSLPELATSIASIYSGSSEVVIGNVVGSNITNIFLVIGVTAIVGKGIKLEHNILHTDIPFLIASVLILYFFVRDLAIGIPDAIFLLAALVIFLASSFSSDDPEAQKEIIEEDAPKSKSSIKDWIFLIGASVLVFLGAKYTIYALERIAEDLSIPTHIIAITAVALGTSLPELMVSVAAARKGKHAMAVGNVLGSNIFNTFAVMSIPRFFGEITIPADTMAYSFPMMVGATILFALATLSNRISKWEGYLFILFYAFFIYELATKGMGS